MKSLVLYFLWRKLHRLEAKIAYYQAYRDSYIKNSSHLLSSEIEELASIEAKIAYYKVAHRNLHTSLTAT